jgi:hypothetical protein
MSFIRRPPPAHDSANRLRPDVPAELRAVEMDSLLSQQVSVLTFHIFQERTPVKANTACGQEVAVFAFLADRLVFLAGLGR